MPESPPLPAALPAKLFESLLHAARADARQALEQYADPDSSVRLRAAVSAGSAVEALLKAVLAQTLPSLLAERGDVHTQLILSGLPGARGKSYLDCRTVGGLEAMRAVTVAKPSLMLAEDDVKRALSVRNAATHLSILTTADLKAGIRSMVATIEVLLPSLATPMDFWGQALLPHAETLREAVADQRMERVEEAKSLARVRLEKLKIVGQSAFEAMAELLDAKGYQDEVEGETARVAHRCPVCEYSGWLSGFVERSNLHYSHEDDYGAPRAWVDRTLDVAEFSCEVCGLYLRSAEVRLAGLPTEVDLEPDSEPEELEIEIEDYWAQQGLDAIRGK